jgi:hypothetical protein
VNRAHIHFGLAVDLVVVSGLDAVARGQAHVRFCLGRRSGRPSSLHGRRPQRAGSRPIAEEEDLRTVGLLTEDTLSDSPGPDAQSTGRPRQRSAR